MLLGLIAGLAAGAFWGLTFVAPSAVQPYTGIDLTVLRYLLFGAISLALMAVSARFRPGRLSRRQIGLALLLGLTGYVIYYVFVAISIRLSGPAIAPLVIGAIPLILAIYGNWRDRTVAWSALVLPLGLMATGLAVVNAGAIAAARDAGFGGQVALGAVCAFIALAVWCSYGVMNANAMRRPDAPGASAWTCLQGVGAMAGVIPLALAAPLLGWTAIPKLGLSGQAGSDLLVWVVLTGALGSWVAQYFWTVASQRLPLALSAQLIVSETVFALLYGFIYELRWPHASEWLGGALLLLGVMLGVRQFSKTGASATHG